MLLGRFQGPRVGPLFPQGRSSSLQPSLSAVANVQNVLTTDATKQEALAQLKEVCGLQQA